MSDMKQMLDALGIERTAIAREYGCSASFVHACLAGRFPMPGRLKALILAMISARRAELKKLVNGGCK